MFWKKCDLYNLVFDWCVLTVTMCIYSEEDSIGIHLVYFLLHAFINLISFAADGRTQL